MEKIYPFKFLDSYKKEDTKLYFGREEEIAQMYEMIFQTNILMVYGASGTGKTSLIQCGLAGKFQAHDWLSIFIRRGTDMNASVSKALTDVGGTPINKETIANEEGNTADERKFNALAHSFKDVYLNSFRPIYLIFDQFEELFTIGNKAEQYEFIDTVKLILKLEQPVKMIFSIREEFLGYLHEFEQRVPELMRKKVRVEPMTFDKISRVIIGALSIKNSYVKIKHGDEDQIDDRIIEKIKGEEKTLSIQLPYLQVFLDKLYQVKTRDKDCKTDAEFSIELVKSMGPMADILRDFLEEQVKAVTAKLNEKGNAITDEHTWKVLQEFITADGTKEPIEETDLLKRLAYMAPAPVQEITERLAASRILRLVDGNIYELAHDTLAKEIAAKRSVEDKAKAEVKRLIKNQVGMQAGARELFTARQLNFIDPYLEMLTLNDDELELVKKSRKSIKSNRRVKYMRIAFLVIGVMMFFVALYAFQLKERSDNARKISDRARQEANLQRRNAEEQKTIAEKQEKMALIEKALATKAKGSAEIARVKAIEQSKLAMLSEKASLVAAHRAKQELMRATRESEIAKQSQQYARQELQMARAIQDSAVRSADVAVQQMQSAIREREQAMISIQKAEKLTQTNDSLLKVISRLEQEFRTRKKK